MRRALLLFFVISSLLLLAVNSVEPPEYQSIYASSEDGSVAQRIAHGDGTTFVAGTSGSSIFYGKFTDAQKGFEWKKTLEVGDEAEVLQLTVKDGEITLVATHTHEFTFDSHDVEITPDKEATSVFVAKLDPATGDLVDEDSVKSFSFGWRPDIPISLPVDSLDSFTMAFGNAMNKIKIPGQDDDQKEINATSLFVLFTSKDEVPIYIENPHEMEVFDPCKDFCKNEGKCTIIEGQAVCNCPEGLDGETCDECEKNDCLNGGTCEVVAGKPTCECTAGLGGVKCDECATDFCQNGGTCEVVAGKPTCECTAGLGGIKCDECATDFCQNGGTCEVVAGKPTCECTEGLGGVKCDECATDFCQNGGTCNVTNGNPTCNCTEGFEGDKCDKSKMKPNRKRMAQQTTSTVFTDAKALSLQEIFATGFRSDETSHSLFVNRYKFQNEELVLLWTKSFDVGDGAAPSLLVHNTENSTTLFVATTTKTEGKGRSAKVFSLDNDGKQVWTSEITGLPGSSAERIPLAMKCAKEGECLLLVSGPSTKDTEIQPVKITQGWTKYHYFLAALQIADGKPLWVREMLADADFGVIKDLAVGASGQVLVAGTVKSEGSFQLDYLDKIDVSKPSMLIGELADADNNPTPTDNTFPTPTADSDKGEIALLPIAAVITVVMIALYCFCWRGRNKKRFRGGRKGQYSRVNDFEMDNVEDVTVFAIDEGGRR